MAAQSSRDILIQTERVEEARAFYEALFEVSAFQNDPQMVGIETGAFRLFVDRRPKLGPILEVLVDDFESRKAALVAAGCTIVEEDSSVPRCYVRDPYGLLFNLGRR
jgi:predicted enzyme related to lactoylglutathione lyase